MEFYLNGAETCGAMPLFWQEVCAAVPLQKYEKERGREQFEVALSPDTPQKTAGDLNTLKSVIAETATRHGLAADFSAGPFPDRPGNGMHIHLHLQDVNGRNVFYKDDARISDALKWSIGGLLAWLPETMPVFAPYPESYARFSDKQNVPTTASWGANNRTVAVRLPDAPHDNKRIEHRVAGSDADPHRVVAVILAAVHYGLKNQCDPGAQIYGDASQPQYALPPLPRTLEEGMAKMKASALAAEKITPTTRQSAR